MTIITLLTCQFKNQLPHHPLLSPLPLSICLLPKSPSNFFTIFCVSSQIFSSHVVFGINFPKWCCCNMYDTSFDSIWHKFPSAFTDILLVNCDLYDTSLWYWKVKITMLVITNHFWDTKLGLQYTWDQKWIRCALHGSLCTLSVKCAKNGLRLTHQMQTVGVSQPLGAYFRLYFSPLALPMC